MGSGKISRRDFFLGGLVVGLGALFLNRYLSDKFFGPSKLNDAKNALDRLENRMTHYERDGYVYGLAGRADWHEDGRYLFKVIDDTDTESPVVTVLNNQVGNHLGGFLYELEEAQIDQGNRLTPEVTLESGAKIFQGDLAHTLRIQAGYNTLGIWRTATYIDKNLNGTVDAIVLEARNSLRSSLRDVGYKKETIDFSRQGDIDEERYARKTFNQGMDLLQHTTQR